MCMVTESWEGMAYTLAHGLGVAREQMVILPGDFELWAEDRVRASAQGVLEEVARGLTRKEQRTNGATGEGGDLLELVGDPEAVQELFLQKQWTDGLPIVVPTEERIQAMMATAKRKPQEVVAFLAPQWGAATVEKLAVNAVMAGCRPEYFPVVTAAVEAMADPEFDLLLHATSNSSATPLAIVNGPVRKALTMNSGYGVFGSVAQANATIGRALRLIRLNIGGQIPGLTDMSTFGHPGEYSMCIAEDEENSPWEPLHVQRGFRAEDSTVTVVWLKTFQGLGNQHAKQPDSLLTIIASSLAWMGCRHYPSDSRDVGDVLIVLSPGYAQRFAAAGFSLRDMQLFLRDRARLPLEEFPQELVPHLQRGGRIDGRHVYIAARPEQFVIFVAGGFSADRGELAAVMHTNPHDLKIITKKIG